MKHIPVYIITVILIFGCKRDPDPDPPLPDPIRSYYTLYNFCTENYDVRWELDGIMVIADHAYGTPHSGVITLNNYSQDVSFDALISGTGTVFKSQVYTMQKDGYYIVAILGSEENPYILFEPANLKPPDPGQLKIRFLQAVQELSAVDVYIGGTSNAFRKITGITYTDITNYEEVTTTEA